MNERKFTRNIYTACDISEENGDSYAHESSA